MEFQTGDFQAGHKVPGVTQLWQTPEYIEAHLLSTAKGRKYLRVRTRT